MKKQIDILRCTFMYWRLLRHNAKTSSNLVAAIYKTNCTSNQCLHDAYGEHMSASELLELLDEPEPKGKPMSEFTQPPDTMTPARFLHDPDVAALLDHLGRLTPEQQLRELLAIMHGDGGHLTALVGLSTSVAIAMRRVWHWREIEASEEMS